MSEPIQGGLQVLPFYIVCDESSSMAGPAIYAVNAGIMELFDALNTDPLLDARALAGIVAFNDTARLLLPMSRLSQVTQIPVCVASGTSSYAAAFRLLRTQLETDVAALQQQFNVHRPCVFFMSDGAPNNENWRAELSKLTDPSFMFSPNIVSFGFAGAEKSVIAEVAHWGSRTGTKFFFMAADDGSPGSAIGEIIGFLMQIVIALGLSRLRKFPFVDGQILGGNGQGSGGVTVFVVDPSDP